MEEPWDELMGPSPEDLKNMLRDKPAADPPAAPQPQPPVRRTPSKAPPPSTMFGKMPDRWTPEQQKVSAARTPSTAGSSPSPRPKTAPALPPVATNTKSPQRLAFEDEEEEEVDPAFVRREALNILEVAESNNFAVHRTSSGGFSAGPRSDGKRVRASLAGLSFSSRRTGRSYHDDEFDMDDNAPSAAARHTTDDDYEYGEYGNDDGVVDVVGMERRSMSSRPAAEQQKNSNWSSRYSVDNTLLALSGSRRSSSSNKVLDRMDRDHDRTSRNLFGGGSQRPKIFGGGGFAFRKNFVFGKQNVTVKPPQQNLQTVWMDMDNGSMPPANSRVKSWQDQLQQKRNQRRRYVLLVLLAFCLTVALASILGKRPGVLGNNNNNSNNGSATLAPGSVTFYVTADAPYDLSAEEKLSSDLKTLSPTASLLVHLGNLQEASVTLCQTSRYESVAALLRESPVPTFVLPGQEDVNNCPDPKVAFDFWKNSFRFFHRHFDGHEALHVMSESVQYENFAIVHQGVLFLGLHLVGGRVHDSEDFLFRNQYNYEWVMGMSKQYQDKVRAVVVLANARPGEKINQRLFDLLGDFWKSFTLPVAYVHANSGLPGGTQAYSPFEGLEDRVIAIQVGNSGENPPLRLNVGFGNRPFIIG